MNEILDRDLVALPAPQDAFAVFTTEGAIDPYLDMIRKAIDAFQADPTTDAGRKEIKSFAFRIAKAKTALEAEGKRLADEQKEIPKKIDATRKQIKDTLDAWRDEVRKPVDDFEAEQAAKEERIKWLLAELQAPIDDREPRNSEYLKYWLGEIRAVETTEAAFAHYAGAAAEIKADAIKVLEARILAAEKQEAEQAELAALRAEKAARDAAEWEAKKAAETERIAAKRAEDAAQAERDKAAAREAQLIKDKEDAERRAADAAAKAQRDLEAKAAAEKAEDERRLANKKHRAKINNEALAALVAAQVPEDLARVFLTLVASNAIPHVSIKY